MLPALNVRLAVCAFSITNRYVVDFQVEFACPEQQVKVTERIELTEIGAIRDAISEPFSLISL
jgi:hypothetical protein